MRSFVGLVCLACLASCMDRAESPLDLERSTEAGGTPAAFAIVPDAERAPEPGERPQLVVIEPDESGAETCWFQVKAIGLPAVRVDGGMIAFIEDDPPGNADAWVGGNDFVTEDLEDIERSDRRRLTDDVWDRGVGSDDITTDDAACRRYEHRLRERVREYNAELRRYRPMQQLDVVVFDPDRFGEIDPSAILPARNVAPEDRPVHALYHGGSFALRVPGLRVLSREIKPDWRSADELCDTDPHIREVWGDPRTNTGVAVVDHISGACLCDDAVTVHSIAVPDAVFEELAARPAERYLQLVDAACEAEAVC